MLARFRNAPHYLAAIIVCYMVAQIIAYLAVRFFWVGRAGERTLRTVTYSIPLTITFSLIAIEALRRRLKKNEKAA